MPSVPPIKFAVTFPVWFGRMVAVIGTVLLAFYYYAPTQEITNATLDYSNYTSFAYFTAKGFQFGQQVIPVVGPLGFVMYGFVYGGHLFWDHLCLDLAITLGLATLLLWFFWHSRRRIFRWLWLAVVISLGVMPLIGDSAFDFAVLFGGLFLLVNPQENRRQQAVELAVAAFLALLALSKSTQLTLSLLSLGLLAVSVRDYRRLARIAGIYVFSFLLFWTLAGQSLANLPGFLRGIKELSVGYNEAMSFQEPVATTVIGGSVVVLLLLAIAGSWFVCRRQRPIGFALLLLGGFTFIIWKHGFVRADGHVTIFFHYACAIAMTALLLLGFGDRPAVPARWEKSVRWAINGCAALAALGGLFGAGQTSVRWELRQLPGLIPAHVKHLLSVRARKAELDRELASQRARFSLPRVAETVGRDRIDFIGSAHGFLTLNRLNYQPRPMGGGSFSVYTPYLQMLNGQYLWNPRTRPAYLLLNLETIDDRLLAQDDSQALIAVIAGYEPIAAEQGMLLLRARPDAEPAAPRSLGERTFVFGEDVPIPIANPGEILLASFELPLNLAGRLRSFLYKPPLLHVHLEGQGIQQPDNRRINAGMVRLPIVLSPVLEQTADLLDDYSLQPGKTVRSFRLTAAAPGFYAGTRLRVRFSALPRPPPLPAATRDSLAGQLRFPCADTPPVLVEPAGSARQNFGGFLVQVVHAPGRLVFPLQGNEREVDFEYGLDPETYERGQTDGVEFRVEVQQPGQAPQLMFRRLLRPLTAPADRGNQTQRVVLVPFVPGSTLTLSTGTGPDNNSAWDWSYLTKIRFKRGAFIAEQFPGFSTLPSRVDATFAGALGQESGPIFMLPPPAALEFTLAGPEKILRLEGGLLPGAYTGEGHSDGAEFIVEFKQPDGSTAPVFRRLLNPRDEPADRGTKQFVVPLPAHASGTVLLVRTGVGPAGSAAWDWTYLSRLDIE
jgi:hypothetical protein